MRDLEASNGEVCETWFSGKLVEWMEAVLWMVGRSGQCCWVTMVTGWSGVELMVVTGVGQDELVRYVQWCW